MTRCFCGDKAINKVRVSDKEIRWLCSLHTHQYYSKDENHTPVFRRGSQHEN